MTSSKTARVKSAPPAERTKSASRQLRGDLQLEILADTDRFSPDTAHIIKHHGIYQQDDRDVRRSGVKTYSCFVRTRLPAGIMTAQQFLAELQLCDEFGNGTLRLTDRQGVQIHGIVKSDLQRVIRTIHESGVTTSGACGDVVRNVMCCPAPVSAGVRQQMQQLAATVSHRFQPRSAAYHELWLREGEESQKLAESGGTEEPLYGQSYLPRKFKIGFALPDDNCIDALTHDLGFVAVVDGRRLTGFDAYVGGGMGVTPARQDTFAAVARPLAFIRNDQLPEFAQAVVELHRDYGNRTDRRLARLRYLIADRGLEWLAERIVQKTGNRMSAPRGAAIHGTADHLGWHAAGSDEFYLGLHVANGRIQDTDSRAVKSGLKEAASRFGVEFRVTPHQNLLLCRIQSHQRAELSRILTDHGVDPGGDVAGIQRQAMACPALPNCGLAITEAERFLPTLLDQLEPVLARLGLADEQLSIRMTGCPNGCTRPYVAEIGIVGKARDRYTVFLGGCVNGTRLAWVYRDLVPRDELPATLESVLTRFAQERLTGESLGDYCARVGRSHLAQTDST